MRKVQAAQQRAQRAALRNAAALGAPAAADAHQVGCQVLTQQVQSLLPAQPVINHLQRQAGRQAGASMKHSSHSRQRAGICDFSVPKEKHTPW
jgi:hypothetical protein